MAVFSDINGNNEYRGIDGEYNQVDYLQSLSELSFARNADGSVTVFHPTLGIDTLNNIDGIWSIEDSAWYSIEDAIALTASNDVVVLNDDFIVNDVVPVTIDEALPTVSGTNGNDTLSGGTGDDVLSGGNGSDILNGNNGADTLNGGRGADTLNGGRHGDTLNGGRGADTLNGDNGWDILNGGRGADTLNGGNGNDDLAGGSGADTLNGGSGADVLNGNNGADTLDGGSGNDLLTGGNGLDVFTFDAGDGHDVITDFTLGSDKIDLSSMGLSFDDVFITTNSEGHVALYLSETQSITIRNLTNLNDLDAGDFILSVDGQAPAPTPVDPQPEPTPVDPEPQPEPQPEGPDTGTTIDGVITGSNDVNDFLNGTGGNDTFFAGRGTDVINGGAGNDTLNVDGDIFEWTFTSNADGSVTMTHPTWGENTLVGIEQILSQRSGETFSIDDAIASTNGLPRFRLDNDNVINGTNGDDFITADANVQGFYGGTGDDTYFGTDAFEQVNYDGSRSEYNITQNGDGSITVAHAIWGTDTLNDIDALIFTGVEPGVGGAQSGPFEFISTDDLFA